LLFYSQSNIWRSKPYKYIAFKLEFHWYGSFLFKTSLFYQLQNNKFNHYQNNLKTHGVNYYLMQIIFIFL